MSSGPPLLPSTAYRIADLAAREEEVLRIAEKHAADRQHTRGKLTARERIDLLVDPGSFYELDRFARHRCTDFDMDAQRPYGDGVVTGQATVDGRPVCLFSQDFTVLGGSMGEVFGEKVLKVMDLAMRIGCPVIGINDSGGARIQEGVVSLAYYAELGRRNVLASGVVPQISLVMGPCAGGAVYTPALTDFVVMVDDIAHMFVTGPEVVAAVTGENVSAGELGSAEVNSEVSGNVHYRATDERDALDWVRTLLGFLPANNLDECPVYASAAHDRTDTANTEDALTPTDLALDHLIPDSPHQGYDMGRLIRAVVDDGEFLAVQERFAPNIICGFGRVEGRTVGVVANQPLHLAGVIDIDASEKAGRFVRFCDAFGIPLLTLVDVPGYLPGVEQERAGIIRRGAKLIYAYAEATVPKVTLAVRKAYGGGYAVMGSKHLGADVNLAWPTAEIAVMGAEAAVTILHRRRLRATDEAEREAVRRRFVEDYRRRFATPYAAADRGYVDRVIRPATSRIEVARAFRMLRDKRQETPARKHGNIPL
ncbi:propionyl-CoA carboxylase beta chain [Streptoalloteichus tenebrarius]|uniref:Propionyl-CoA carboxylase beta chain n=1 Tax=Streptoalloteichus tenebrarius (strain ATCC 17920 / DSM 40477 / JCM 4838 / CBS 697.72 / NBRC 16177 / NCIMB 11028 / NRRL B-12390 / A12253. 1 / ISP 5477) TaxID=1933 RepID=A0ABT1HLR8_STRSD|nr:acyl-CoA carboxylase subunit beta [Streptoalloteichus tenebrarius]MCP2256456.1 propionyl-CoA carboxylase beta chain [Streptoalloteichus tenebrarius]BFF04807.1 acyl-CoA carboxylase subunit beta [Streptoalloteichus tenebrarius]